MVGVVLDSQGSGITASGDQGILPAPYLLTTPTRAVKDCRDNWCFQAASSWVFSSTLLTCLLGRAGSLGTSAGLVRGCWLPGFLGWDWRPGGGWEWGRGFGGWERVGVMRWDWGWDDQDKEGVSDRTLNGGAGNGVGARGEGWARLCSLLP